MKRVTGIGGLFFKCDDPEKMKSWYEEHLGIPMAPHGAMFTWRSDEAPEETGHTIWSPFERDSDYFSPSKKEFMFNYRVENLEALLDALKSEGVTVVGEIESYPYGKFGWIMDPEGNKIELWEPVAEGFGGETD